MLFLYSTRETKESPGRISCSISCPGFETIRHLTASILCPKVVAEEKHPGNVNTHY
jgi:hypothetical protein